MARCCRCAGSRSRSPAVSSWRRSVSRSRARDKVGLVGRNGAGKTSLLRVLGGAARPTPASCTATARSVTSRRTRSSTASTTTSSGLTHVLSGRGLDEAIIRLEKLRLATRRGSRPTRTWRGSPDAQDAVRARRRLRGRVRGPAPRRRARARTDRLDLPIGVAVRRRAAPRRAGAHPVRRQRPAPARRADQPPRQRRPRLAARLPASSTAARCSSISHDLDLLDEAITRVLHLDRGGRRRRRHAGRVQGHVLAVPRRPRRKDEERLAKMAARQQAEIDRLQRLVDRFGGQGRPRRRWRTASKRASSASRAGAVECAEGAPRARASSSPRRRRRAHRARGRRLWPSPTARSMCSTTSASTSAGASGCSSSGLNGAGKTSLLRILAGESTPTAARCASATTSRSATTRRSTKASPPGARCSTTCASKSIRRCATRSCARLLGMFGAHRREGASRTPSTLSGGEKTKLALAQLVAGTPQPACCSTSRPTTSTPVSRAATAAALGAWPGTMIIVSHDTDFVRQLAARPRAADAGGDLDYWRDDLLDLVELA